MAAITNDKQSNNNNSDRNLQDIDEVDFVTTRGYSNYNNNSFNNNNNNNDIKLITDYDEQKILLRQQQQQQQIATDSNANADKEAAVTANGNAVVQKEENVPNTTMTTTTTTETKQQLVKTVPNNTNTNTNASTPTTPKQKHHKRSLFHFGKSKSLTKLNSSSNNKNKETQEEEGEKGEKEAVEKAASAEQTVKADHQRKEQQQNANAQQNGGTGHTETAPPPAPRQHKFVKSNSISRLLGNTYNAKKFERAEQKRRPTDAANDKKYHTISAGQQQRRRRDSGAYLERFKSGGKEKNSSDSSAEVVLLNHSNNSEHESHDNMFILTTDTRELYANGSRNELIAKEKPHKVDYNSDLGSRAMRTLTRGLGKLWWKRSHSVDISTPDPEYKVSYLGNVLTGWAKGEGCVEKQLNTLWRNYTQNSKPDVIMRIKVCASGIKATTRQHGLTEYWANRITHCCAPKNYPRVFCWIYRHEGRKLKHELRCHAVLCSKERIVQEICKTLKENLEAALRDFKREKILKQNARLSLANAVYDNPSLPRRKILLSVGGNNYRPPLERSKSAPKLTAIEEAIGEEDGEEIEDTNEPEMMPCCQKDSLYPAMTLGRRRCRRGHSIRRTGKVKLPFDTCATLPKTKEKCCGNAHSSEAVSCKSEAPQNEATATDAEQRNSYGSDESDEFDKLLRHNNYDATASLSHELLPYFDMQLHKNSSISLGSLSELKNADEPLSLPQTINSDPSAHPNADYDPNAATSQRDHAADLDGGDTDVEEREVAMVGLRRTGVCSDGEEDYLDEEDLYFRQNTILNMLHRNSMRKMAALQLSSDESSLETHNSYPHHQHRHQAQSSICSNASSTATDMSSSASTSSGLRKQNSNLDSDEGSISSGCETASTVTANQDDLSLSYRQGGKMHAAHNEYSILDEEHSDITVDDIYERLESRLQKRNNSDATTFSSSSSITLKMGNTPNASMQNGLDELVCDNTEGTKSSTTTTTTSMQRQKRTRKHTAAQRNTDERNEDDTDSECSDESGYVEFQERAQKQTTKTTNSNSSANNTTTTPTIAAKPQIPPKPMPRRSLLKTTTVAATTTSV